MRSKIQAYSEKRTFKQLGIIMGISFLVFTLVIIFGFVSTGEVIDASGYTTTQYQTAGNKENMDTILKVWQADDIFPTANLQLFYDYIFILAGVSLFIHGFVLYYKVFEGRELLQNISVIGIILTILSRTSDAIENTISLVIINSYPNYPDALAPALNYVRIIKFGIVGVEYTVFFVLGLITIFVKFQQRK